MEFLYIDIYNYIIDFLDNLSLKNYSLSNKFIYKLCEYDLSQRKVKLKKIIDKIGVYIILKWIPTNYIPLIVSVNKEHNQRIKLMRKWDKWDIPYKIIEKDIYVPSYIDISLDNKITIDIDIHSFSLIDENRIELSKNIYIIFRLDNFYLIKSLFIFSKNKINIKIPYIKNDNYDNYNNYIIINSNWEKLMYLIKSFYKKYN